MINKFELSPSFIEIIVVNKLMKISVSFVETSIMYIMFILVKNFMESEEVDQFVCFFFLLRDSYMNFGNFISLYLITYPAI